MTGLAWKSGNSMAEAVDVPMVGDLEQLGLLDHSQTERNQRKEQGGAGEGLGREQRSMQ